MENVKEEDKEVPLWNQSSQSVLMAATLLVKECGVGAFRSSEELDSRTS